MRQLDSSKIRSGHYGSFFILLAAIVLYLVPQNYVLLSSSWRLVVQLTTIAGGLLAVYVAATRQSKSIAPLAALSISLLIGAQLSSGSGLAVLYFLCPVFVGISAGIVLRDSPKLIRLFVVMFIASVGSLVWDMLAGSSASAAIFGEVNRLTLNSDTRLRGIAGQPVPAAMTVTLVVVLLAVLVRGEAKARVRCGAGSIVLGGAAFSLAVTGTRSALLILAIGLLAGAWLMRRSSLTRANPLSALAVLSLLTACALWVAPVAERYLGTLRLFSFDDLGASESSINRLHAFTILENWQNNCDVACKGIGSGPRSLQSALQTNLGINGLSTVDNVYVTVLWDFGVLGILALGLLVVMGFRALWWRDRTINESAAVAGLFAFLAAGAFFDTVYTTPVLVIASICAGILIGGARPKSRTAMIT